MPRALSALAMARHDVAALAFICSMTGSTFAAKRSAFALLEAPPLSLRFAAEHLSDAERYWRVGEL